MFLLMSSQRERWNRLNPSWNASITTGTTTALLVTAVAEWCNVRWLDANFGKREETGMGQQGWQQGGKRPTSQPNSALPSAEAAVNEQPEQSQKHVPVKNAPARSPLSGQSALRVCGLYECAGMERLGEHDGEGGWVGGGRGGAKGEPWLMKWLRFSKPPPSLQSCHGGTPLQCLNCFLSLPHTHTHTFSSRGTPTKRRQKWNGIMEVRWWSGDPTTSF